MESDALLNRLGIVLGAVLVLLSVTTLLWGYIIAPPAVIDGLALLLMGLLLLIKSISLLMDPGGSNPW